MIKLIFSKGHNVIRFHEICKNWKIISPFVQATNITAYLILVKFKNKSSTHIPKCNDHLECEKYEKWNNIKNVLHVYVWNKMCNVQTMANIAISCKDIVEKTKRNIKKLFKNCVYEYIVRVYHFFLQGLSPKTQVKVNYF